MDDCVQGISKIESPFSTIVEILRYRAVHQPEQLAFTFLPDGEIEGAQLTYRELDRLGRAIAAKLQTLGLSGERALLLYPPGLNYIAAFLGCLYAGVVAVPAYPPGNKRKTQRIQSILADARASIAMTETAILPKAQSFLAGKTGLEDLQWLATDNLDNGIETGWQDPCINTNNLAFLQYTSGSTGTPKGVMLNHGNLLHNAAMLYRVMEHSPSSKFVSWLPIYHDMGLIAGILQPIYGGFPCILMPPTAFLQRPYRWLKAISHYKGTTSGAPNFAYDLCVRKIAPEQRETLDLSSWDVAFNGAEPVRHDTLEQFAAAFAPCGFRKQALYPCYGMAEATLIVSGGQKKALPVSQDISAGALERNRVMKASVGEEDRTTIVGCGQTIPEQQVIIAHPEGLTQCPPDEVGEVWVSGPGVCQGYWHRPEETEKTFRAYLSDKGEGPFLRTGDLGFLQDGELFITGRAKDLIIIRGRNLYPQDIELTAERSHPSLRSGSNAAFAIEVDSEERLAIVQELEFRQKPDVEEVASAIRQAVAEEYEVQAHAVVLIKPGSILKTSSGKIQRRACRAEFLAGNLNVIGSSILDVSDFEDTGRSSLNREVLLGLSPSEGQPLLEFYLQDLVARGLGADPSKINPQQPLSTLGLDSLRVFELKNRIEVDLGVAVSVADFFEGWNIVRLATKILTQLTTENFIPSIPLTKVQKSINSHPLSFAQQRLWFLDQLEKGNPAYNIAFSVRLRGLLKETALERSLNEIVQRHEALRTTFSLVEGQPVQVIDPCLRLPLPVVDCQNLSELERQSEVRRLAIQQSQQPFDLTRGPLLRAQLLRLDQQEHILLMSMHHIISDEWSVEVFIREMAALYKAFSTDRSQPLPELPIQYKDFAYWQRQWLRGEVLETQLSYWKQQLDGIPAVLPLPADRPRPAVRTYRGSRQFLELPKTLTEEIEALSRQEGVTPFMFLLAAFQTLLYRYTGQEDIPVGSPIANRNRDEIKGAIGFFVNTLVLRANLGGNPSFRELLSRVRQVALEAYSHQDLPFEQLVEVLQPERDVSYTPLFQVLFTLRNPLRLEEIPDLVLSPLKVENDTTQFDLILSVEIAERGLIALFEYNTDLFDATTIARMQGHFLTLLEGIVANPQAGLSDLRLLTPAERHQILVEWNNTNTDDRLDRCIHQLFETRVEKTPSAVAVLFEGQQLTYRQLNQRANRLARYLKKLGVKPDVLVGICVERASLAMAVGILGILKAGGACVPLEPTYPQQRLAFMLSDARVPVLLTQENLRVKLPEDRMRVVCLDTDWERIEEESQENFVSDVRPENLAYVIYTSGSAGKPKGVLVSHRGLSNLVEAQIRTFDARSGSRILQFAPLDADASVSEIFMALCSGATLCLGTADSLLSGLALSRWLYDRAITHAILTPSALAALPAEELPALQTIVVAGETRSPNLVAKWSKNKRVFNAYGATESTVCATVSEWSERDRTLSIGRPIANTQVYILDRYLQPVPIGTPGELHIAGAGLARGYLNHPDLTEEKFIPNPFSDEPGTRLYKTGDLARYLPDGTIAFLDRPDDRVKIRGYCIELGEIEAVLVKHPSVEQTAVIAGEGAAENRYPIAYIVPKQQGSATPRELRRFLKNKLPKYMVPAVFVMLESLPSTPCGRVDRCALAKAAQQDKSVRFVLPDTPTEEILVAIWSDVLGVEVGIHDNFFDLGGDFLLAPPVIDRVRKIFRVDLSVRDLLEVHNTVTGLAEAIVQKMLERERPQEMIQLLEQLEQMSEEEASNPSFG